MTRKRFIKLLMANGQFDRNTAVNEAQFYIQSDGAFTYSEVFEAIEELSEIVASVSIAVASAMDKISCRAVTREEWSKYKSIYRHLIDISERER